MAAETEVVTIDDVNPIYGHENATQWGPSRRKTYRNNQLDQNADVIFAVFSPVHPPNLDKLHCLEFKPTSDPNLWMRFIEANYKKLTVQWTHRKVTEPVRDVITIYGKARDLGIFSKHFPNHLQEINNNHVDVEELRARIQELELQCRTLTRQLTERRPA